MSLSPQAQVISDIRIVRSTSFCSYVLLVWDFFLTIEDEITYIWGSPRSAVKILYLCNRYGNLLMQPISLAQTTGLLNINESSVCGLMDRLTNTHQVCLAYVWIRSLGQFLSYGSVHILILLRAWVLSGRGRNATIGLFAAFMVYFVSCLALMIYALGAHRVGTPFLGLVDVFSLVFQRPLNFMANSICLALINITGQRLAIGLRQMYVCKKDLTPSELSKEVREQLAGLSLLSAAEEPAHELEPVAP
ncbi:hypothetical protein BV22DRAFT_1013153 [Leucogyrophana mollusca]|uniref:Uncharacterized protein n=1 Tax=Leucogyrophana mollusca TaxID=85980 RepID=A0ACB8BJ21_9AGAM|nr:hypothetical protein BV22DRAFT_1013153 [Leucogyrophana mollusca]